MRVKNRSEINRRALQSEVTRAELLTAARTLFAKKGYSSVSIDEVAQAAGNASKGAVYHHFTDKLGLFREVYESEQVALVERIERAAVSVADPWHKIELACLTMCDALQEPSVRRIIFVDAPSALGDEWRSLNSKYALGATRDLLRVAIDAGVFDKVPLEPLAHMVLAAVDGAALYLAAAPRVADTRRKVALTMIRLLEGLKKSGKSSSVKKSAIRW